MQLLTRCPLKFKFVWLLPVLLALFPGAFASPPFTDIIDEDLTTADTKNLQLVEVMRSNVSAHVPPTPKERACANNPHKVDWKGLRKDLISLFSDPHCVVKVENSTLPPIHCRRLTGFYVRAAFHDAGTTKDGKGGADGSIVLSSFNPHNRVKEAEWEGNRDFVPYVQKSLAPLVAKYGASWADTLVVAGAVSSEFAGRKPDFTVWVGRCDNYITNPHILPAAEISCKEFADYWAGQGLTLRQGVALMGSHVMNHDNNRSEETDVLQFAWSNRYYQYLNTGNISIHVPTHGNITVKWTVDGQERSWRYTVNDAFLAPQNVLRDSKCPEAERRQIAFWMKYFAHSNAKWDANYEGAYVKMGATAGVRWAKKTMKVDLRPCAWKKVGGYGMSNRKCASTCMDLRNYPNIGGTNCALVTSGQCKCT